MDRSNGGRGLLHVHLGRTDRLLTLTVSQATTLPSLFEDREGNIWVATVDGLDRFRDFAVPTITVRQGLSSALVESILAATDGSIWIGTVDGLNRWNHGQIAIQRKRSMQSSRGGPGGSTRTSGAVREITGSGLPDD